RPAPARSATARSSSGTWTRWCGSAPASWTPTRSERTPGLALHPVAAALLGAVQGGIGARQQGVVAVAGALHPGGTDTGGDPQLRVDVVEAQRGGRHAQAFGHRQRLLQRGVRADHHEFLAADPADRIAPAQLRL